MSTASIFVYGASGHGKVVADICSLRASLWARAERTAVALGRGDNSARQAVMDSCADLRVEVLTVGHPKAAVAASARIGRGTVVMAGAAINPDVQVGDGVMVNTGVVIEHDTISGAYWSTGPHRTRCGGPAGITMGDGSIVGAGSAVVRDIPSRVIAIGVPARVTRRVDCPSPARNP